MPSKRSGTSNRVRVKAEPGEDDDCDNDCDAYGYGGMGSGGGALAVPMGTQVRSSTEVVDTNGAAMSVCCRRRCVVP